VKNGLRKKPTYFTTPAAIFQEVSEPGSYKTLFVKPTHIFKHRTAEKIDKITNIEIGMLQFIMLSE